jgi:hypothetical protein
MIDLVDQLLRARHLEVPQQQRREGRGGPALVRLAQHGAQRRTPDPVAAPLVAEHVAPPARPGGEPLGIAAVRDRTGARDDHDTRLPGRAGFERDQRIVDDEHARLVADPLHDAAHDVGVVGAIDAGDPEADGGGYDVAVAEGVFHHLVQDLLDLQLPHRLEVGAGRTGFRDDRPVSVGELAHGLGAARIYAEHMHDRKKRAPRS